MSFIRLILGLFCIVIVYSACPHPNFVAKHLCTYCNNKTGDANVFALRVARNRRLNPSRTETNLNSVFIARSMQYRKLTMQNRYGQLQDYCVFQRRVPKWDCSPFGNVHHSIRHVWQCNYTVEIIATHIASNGHYESGLDH